MESKIINGLGLVSGIVFLLAECVIVIRSIK